MINKAIIYGACICFGHGRNVRWVNRIWQKHFALIAIRIQSRQLKTYRIAVLPLPMIQMPKTDFLKTITRSRLADRYWRLEPPALEFSRDKNLG